MDPANLRGRDVGPSWESAGATTRPRYDHVWSAACRSGPYMIKPASER